MKKILIISFFFGFYLKSLSQNVDYNNFLLNEGFLTDIFKTINVDEIHTNLINKIIEKKVTLDSNSKVLDTLILNVYIFNDLGEIIEHQYDFSENNKYFLSEKFIYNSDKTKVDTIKKYYYPIDFNIIDGGKCCYYHITSVCDKFDSKKRIITQNIEIENGYYEFINISYSYLKQTLLKLIEVETDKNYYLFNYEYSFFNKFDYEKK